MGEKRVLIGAPVRQDDEIFKSYLEGLRGLLIPEGVAVDKYFILHNSEHLNNYIEVDELWTTRNSEESYIVDDTTHHWSNKNILELTEMKNYLLNYTYVNGYDYFFLVDSDLVLHPKTLEVLLERASEKDKDMVANIFWTSWVKGDPEMPNAWDYDNYSFLEESLYNWEQPGCYRVGMTGACILIPREVIEVGINYSRVPNLSYDIFWGEDRHFCIKAACHGYSMWIETTYPAKHLYRKERVD